MKKKTNIMLLLYLTAVLLILAGCGNKPATDPGNAEPAPNTTPSNGSSPSAPDAEKKESQEIKVGYVDSELTQVKTKKAQIEFSNNNEKYTQAFDVMQRSDDPEYISLWSDIGLESLEFHEADGALTLNIHIPDEARLGSGGELLFLDTLKQTMFQFKEIESIQLLVDGKESESLMGHVELENPIVRGTE
ncbi:GerMN domain-containing protein [Paenibacillus polysaccharolyticus]|uniref:GerMN domain-containing protein n=1 Tax=Paenibacillus polysaccharolyticus TaxID=582692 RepID=UPI003009FE32